MALNSLSGIESLAQVINAKMDDLEIVGLIQQNLSAGLKDVASQMGRSEDEAEILLHKVVQALLFGEGVGGGNLDSKEGRDEWERTLSVMLKREIGQLDQTLEGVDNIRRQERQERKDKTAEADEAIISETAASMEAAISFDKPAFWRPRIMLTLDNVVVREGHDALRASSPNFERMLEWRAVLSNTGSLVRLVKLQEGLARRFGGRLESSLVESITVAKFLEKHDADDWLGPLVEVFLNTFNNVRGELTASSFWGKQAIEYCEVRIN